MEAKDDKRNYNVFFNTHTVSGIVVAIVLYIIFLAGAFALFRDEIDEWEFNRVSEKERQESVIDYDKVVENIVKHTDHDLYGRNLSIRKRGEGISIRGSKSFDTIGANGTIKNNNKSINITLDKHTLMPLKRGNRERNGNQGGQNTQTRNTNRTHNGNQADNSTQKNSAGQTSNRSTGISTSKEESIRLGRQLDVKEAEVKITDRKENSDQITDSTQKGDTDFAKRNLGGKVPRENENASRKKSQTEHNPQPEANTAVSKNQNQRGQNPQQAGVGGAARNRGQAQNNTQTVDKERLRGIGDIVYRLHFLRQLGFGTRWGMYIAGFVSLLLLFATVTGVIVHWKKIIEFFYTFRVDLSLKKIWKDSHTVLGVITTPFLMLFALTGIVFCISNMTRNEPIANYLFDGDTEIRSKIMSTSITDTMEPLGKTTKTTSINSLIDEVALKEELTFDKERTRVSIVNFGDKNAAVKVSIYKNEEEKVFLGRGEYIFSYETGELLNANRLSDNDFTTSISNVFRTLHYAEFGGILNKVLFFVLALVCCWIFLSGVLLWLGERKDSRKLSAGRKKFNTELIYVYLAVAFGLHIAVADGFILAKILPFDTLHIEQMRDSNYIHTRKDLLSVLFFTSWLFFSTFLYLLKNNFKIFKMSLWLTGFLSFLIPVLNGFIDKQWVWVSFNNGQMGSFYVDVLWFLVGVANIYMAININENSLPKRKIKPQPKPKPKPIDRPVKVKRTPVVEEAQVELVDFITKTN